MDSNGIDPFDSITQLCFLSDSQEEILRRCSFAGNPKSVDDSGSVDSQNLSLQPPGIFMATLPERLEQREKITPHDTFQTPPEQSGRRRPVAVDSPSLQDAAAIKGARACDSATGVDLGKNNNDLGFGVEVQSSQQTAEIEHFGVRRTRREVSESESASKRLKLSKEALGTESSVPMAVEESATDVVSAKTGGESKVVDPNGEMTEEWVTVAEDCSKIEDGKVSNGEETTINESKGGKTEGNSKETIYDAMASGNSGKPKSILMEILKILAKEETEEDKNLANMSLLDVVKSRGMTFPRPCWWPPEGKDSSFK